MSRSLDFVASLVADLVYERRFKDKDAWTRCIGVYMTPWLNIEKASAFAEAVSEHFYAIEKVSP